MVCKPTPTELASKLVSVTPGPEYVPPVGVPPESSKVELARQSVLVVKTKLTVGKAKTVIS